MNRYKDANKVSIMGIIGNIFLIIIKVLVFLITHSKAMLSDALNSLGDIISSVMTFVGNKISSKGPDQDHNYGHGKIEYIISMLISVIMISLSISVLVSSIKSLFVKTNYKFSIFLIIVSISTILVKFIMYIIARKIAKKYDNLMVLANAKDHLNDCFLTTLNLIAAVFGYFGYTYIDGIVGSIISVFILITGLSIFKSAYDILMDKGMSNDLRDKIVNIIESHNEIKKYDNLKSTPIGYLYQISIVIYVDGKLSTYKSHEIASKLEDEINALDGISATIVHVNPIKKKN